MEALRINDKLKKFSKDNDYRLIGMIMETPKGSTIKFQGCVTKEDSEELAKIFRRIVKLTDKVEKTADE